MTRETALSQMNHASEERKSMTPDVTERQMRRTVKHLLILAIRNALVT